LCDDADESLHFDLLCPHVVIADPRLTIRRSHACRENADSGRLPGAVWTKQPKISPPCTSSDKTIQRHDLARRLVLPLATETKPTTAPSGGGEVKTLRSSCVRIPAGI
jgi:hypothetical protein